MRFAKLVAAACLVAAVVIVGRAMPVASWTTTLVSAIRGAGIAGVALFVVVYIGACALMLPGSVLAMVAGFAYGPVWGLVVAWPASVVAGSTAFLLGRTILRGWAERLMRRSHWTRAFDRAVSRDGFKLVVLLRISPVAPFTVLNYVFGLSSISLRDFVIASALGEIPGAWLYVYLGSLVTTVAQLSAHRDRFTPPQLVIYAGGLIATLVAAIVLGRMATRALREEHID